MMITSKIISLFGIISFGALCLGVLALILWEASSRTTLPSTPSIPAGMMRKVTIALISVGVLLIGYLLVRPRIQGVAVPEISFEWIFAHKKIIAGVVITALAIAGAFGKGGSAGKVALFVIGLGVSVFLVRESWYSLKYGKDSEKIVAELQQRNVHETLTEGRKIEKNSTRTEGNSTSQSEVEFPTQRRNGVLPVGVWSETLRVGIGCSIRFPKVWDGVRAQYRFYSPVWKEYQTGSSPNANEMRFMVEKGEVTTIPYFIEC